MGNKPESGHNIKWQIGVLVATSDERPNIDRERASGKVNASATEDN